ERGRPLEGALRSRAIARREPREAEVARDLRVLRQRLLARLVFGDGRGERAAPVEAFCTLIARLHERRLLAERVVVELDRSREVGRLSARERREARRHERVRGARQELGQLESVLLGLRGVGAALEAREDEERRREVGPEAVGVDRVRERGLEEAERVEQARDI